ncbi:unnamed protein product [Cuscuta europaea]|uniref:Uncharacterized protein n=1 Tax=Cuscuta europaea TaxID=41803 RepID=A0A9P0Z3X9_CUSEU|nr:unnamed protein product [Cuscuta europaea]
MVNGLTESYDTVASIIQQCNPLPLFYKARSMILLEETRKAQQSGVTSAAALVHTGSPSPATTSPRPTRSVSHGRGRTSRSNKPRNSVPTHGASGHSASLWPMPPPWAYYLPNQWTPPCPYPTTGTGSMAPRFANPGAGILGPRLTQAHTASYMQPTDIAAAMHTMSLTPPDTN